MPLIFRILIPILFFQSTMFGVGTQFLAIPQNVMELIIGVNPIIHNIANKPILSASYGNWLADMKMSSLSYNRHAFGGSAGFDFRYITLNDLELRTDRPTDDPLAVFGATAIAFDGNYIRQTKSGLIITKLRYISMQFQIDTKSYPFQFLLSIFHQIPIDHYTGYQYNRRKFF